MNMFPYHASSFIKLHFVAIENGTDTVGVKTGMAYVTLFQIFMERVEKWAPDLHTLRAAKHTQCCFLTPLFLV